MARIHKSQVENKPRKESFFKTNGSKFSPAKTYYDFWVKLLESYGSYHDRILSQHGAQPTSQELGGWNIGGTHILKLPAGSTSAVLCC